MKIRSMKIMVLLPALFAVPFISHAQELPPEDVLDTPIDSWLLVLIAAGIVYGAFKIRRYKKQTAG